MARGTTGHVGQRKSRARQEGERVAHPSIKGEKRRPCREIAGGSGQLLRHGPRVLCAGRRAVRARSLPGGCSSGCPGSQGGTEHDGMWRQKPTPAGLFKRPQAAGRQQRGRRAVRWGTNPWLPEARLKGDNDSFIHAGWRGLKAPQGTDHRACKWVGAGRRAKGGTRLQAAVASQCTGSRGRDHCSNGWAVDPPTVGGRAKAGARALAPCTRAGARQAVPAPWGGRPKGAARREVGEGPATASRGGRLGQSVGATGGPRSSCIKGARRPALQGAAFQRKGAAQHDERARWRKCLKSRRGLGARPNKSKQHQQIGLGRSRPHRVEAGGKAHAR